MGHFDQLMDVPDVKYARSGNVAIAYQVVGTGPLDLVFIRGTLAELLTASTVKDLVAGSGIEFEERGERELKGVPGTWRLYAVSGEDM
jgi:hypothetical protein